MKEYNMTEDKRKRCCFTGHRPDKIGNDEYKIKEMLKSEIQKSISEGYLTFISGMALGVDVWAAEIVIQEKLNNPEVKLICASPYPGFERNRCLADRMKYHEILNNADYIINISEQYTKFCFQIRNMWMVDRSEKVIAVFNGSKGGTYNTVKYAEKKNIQVVNVLTEN